MTAETSYNVLLAEISVFCHSLCQIIYSFQNFFFKYYLIFNYNDDVMLVSTTYYDSGLIMEDHDFMNGKRYKDIAMLLWTKSYI